MMREVPLKNDGDLSELVREIEETGVEVVLTRNGRPSAKLSPLSNNAQSEDEQLRQGFAALRKMRDRRDLGAEVISWEELKAEGRNEDKDWAS